MCRILFIHTSVKTLLLAGVKCSCAGGAQWAAGLQGAIGCRSAPRAALFTLVPLLLLTDLKNNHYSFISGLITIKGGRDLPEIETVPNLVSAAGVCFGSDCYSLVAGSARFLLLCICLGTLFCRPQMLVCSRSAVTHMPPMCIRPQIRHPGSPVCYRSFAAGPVDETLYKLHKEKSPWPSKECLRIDINKVWWYYRSLFLLLDFVLCAIVTPVALGTLASSLCPCFNQKNCHFISTNLLRFHHFEPYSAWDLGSKML